MWIYSIIGTFKLDATTYIERRSDVKEADLNDALRQLQEWASSFHRVDRIHITITGERKNIV